MSDESPLYRCTACCHEARYDELPTGTPEELWPMLQAGELCSDKICPECQALCLIVKPATPLRIAIVEILEARGEGLLDDHGVDRKVAEEIADDIIALMPDQEPEEPVAFGFNYHDMFEEANRNGLALTRQEARDLIERLNRKGDASTGVSWDTIAYWIGEMKIGRPLTGEETAVFESTGEAITQP